jgi:hypothetical protein
VGLCSWRLGANRLPKDRVKGDGGGRDCKIIRLETVQLARCGAGGSLHRSGCLRSIVETVCNDRKWRVGCNLKGIKSALQTGWGIMAPLVQLWRGAIQMWLSCFSTGNARSATMTLHCKGQFSYILYYGYLSVSSTLPSPWQDRPEQPSQRREEPSRHDANSLMQSNVADA